MNVIIKTCQSTQLYWFRTLKRYRNKIKPVNICETVRTAKSILFCLPNEPLMSAPAQQLISQFAGRYPDWEMTLVANASASKPSLKKTEVIVLGNDDLNYFGKPKAKWLERIALRKYDLAIDLGISYDFSNLVIIWSVDANLRVGFHDIRREDFFSFLFRRHPNTPADKAYQELLKHFEALM